MTNRINQKAIEFVVDTVFDFARDILENLPEGGREDISDAELNSLVVNVTMSGGLITGMFLEGYEYLLTVDKQALYALN